MKTLPIGPGLHFEFTDDSAFALENVKSAEMCQCQTHGPGKPIIVFKAGEDIKRYAPVYIGEDGLVYEKSNSSNLR